MSYAIQHEKEFFFDFMEDGHPVWCKAIDARREFSSRVDAVRMRDRLNQTYKLTSRIIDMSKPGNKKLYAFEAEPLRG